MSTRKMQRFLFERGDHIDYILEKTIDAICEYTKDDTKGENRATTSFEVTVTSAHTKRERKDGTSTTSFAK